MIIFQVKRAYVSFNTPYTKVRRLHRTGSSIRQGMPRERVKILQSNDFLYYLTFCEIFAPYRLIDPQYLLCLIGSHNKMPTVFDF